MTGISGEALHFATSLVTGAKNSNEVMAFATFFTSFMGSDKNFRGQAENAFGYGGIFSSFLYVNHRYGPGWQVDRTRTVLLTLDNFRQDRWNDDRNCVLASITRIFAFYRDVHEMSVIPRNNTLYRHIRDIALQHGYRPMWGTPPTRIDNIMNDMLSHFNLDGSVRHHLTTLAYAKRELDAGRPFLLNVATGFYANHTVTVTGYRTYTRGNETKTFLSVYDGWTEQLRFIDFHAFNTISSMTTMTIK